MKREKQMTFANTGFERYSRQTKRAVFLDEMNALGGQFKLYQPRALQNVPARA
jgi:hypothetical protein